MFLEDFVFVGFRGVMRDLFSSFCLSIWGLGFGCQIGRLEVVDKIVVVFFSVIFKRDLDFELDFGYNYENKD